MKYIFFYSALAALGLAWIGETLSANRTAAELSRLRQQRAEIARLLHERDGLFQRLSALEKLEKTPQDLPATANPTIGARPEAPLRVTLPLGDWVGVGSCGFRGQATPQASIESTLWAAAGGDVANLKQLLWVSNETRQAAVALLASIPAANRMTYQSPDDLIAALTIKRIPLGEAQLVWLNQNDPDHATACVFVKDPLDPASVNEPAPVPPEEGPSPPQLPPDPKSVIAYLALQREGDRWRLVVPPTAIGRLARNLITAAQPGS